jgi:hypothetical protein
MTILADRRALTRKQAAKSGTQTHGFDAVVTANAVGRSCQTSLRQR